MKITKRLSKTMRRRRKRAITTTVYVSARGAQ
jgi:hypothetical protein